MGSRLKMKTYLKTICVGNFYNYNIYKITDSVGRSYYCAEPTRYGVTRIAENETTLTNILNSDVKQLNQIHSKTK